MLSINKKTHIIRYVLILQFFNILKKFCFQQNCKKMFSQLNSASWVKLNKVIYKSYIKINDIKNDKM